ncbi:MAG: HlyD family efflux transporter periplasmic adaptor subunit [Desulfobulbaceae bacterium]
MMPFPESKTEHAMTFFFRLLVLLPFLLLPGCRENNHDFFQGYVEGDFLHIGAPAGGRLLTLAVSRGMRIEKDAPLFAFDTTVEEAALAEAQQGLARAENRLADLRKGLRPSEIRALEARLAEAVAARELARAEYERRKRLHEQKAVSRDVLDRSRTELEKAEAAVTRVEAELETARLGGRSDQVAAAEAEVEAARQRVSQARWRLEQQWGTAPEAGLVFDTFYEPGEYVPPGYPVVSLLPPGRIKIRFFVPEEVVGTLRTGEKVRLSFDGADREFRAAISFISPRPEYTPPVIYSRKSRTHLVFLVEAVPAPEDAALLHPGQPVDVRLERADV